MNRAAKIAGGVFDELVGQRSHYQSQIYHFGVMIGQYYGMREEFMTPEKMREEVARFKDRFPKIIPEINRALSMFESGTEWIEAIERCTGYYDEKTGRAWREILAEEEAVTS